MEFQATGSQSYLRTSMLNRFLFTGVERPRIQMAISTANQK